MSNGSMEKVLNQALKFLERRLHTVHELRRKLEMKGCDQKLVEEAIRKLIEQDYLNDRRFAEIFLDNLIKYKTFGFYGLKAKLLQRGIDRELIEDLLSTFSIAEEKQVAQRLLDRKKEKDPVRLARTLSSKGFRTQVIKEALALQIGD